VEETTEEMLQSVFAVNVFALWHTVRPALHHMRTRGRGHILMVSSMAGKVGFPFNSAYVAAKHAVVGFTHALRAELVETGIHASVICPGGVETDFAAVTEGGPLAAILAEAGAATRRIAQERDLPLVPVEGVLSPDAVASRIVECLHLPVAEVYTHRGAAAFAALAASDREAAERLQQAAILGETEVYNQKKKSTKNR
jgi:short-subunit dehydrogenase